MHRDELERLLISHMIPGNIETSARMLAAALMVCAIPVHEMPGRKVNNDEMCFTKRIRDNTSGRKCSILVFD